LKKKRGGDGVVPVFNWHGKNGREKTQITQKVRDAYVGQ
jgi:hypothetical protein